MSDFDIVSANIMTSPASLLASNFFDLVPAIVVSIYIPGYSASGTAQLQFNGDTGSTAYAFSVSENFAAPTTGIAGAATGLQVCQTANIPITEIVFWIANFPGQSHGIRWIGAGGVTDASAAPKVIVGAGMWNNTAQINQVQLNSGGVNMNAGTRIGVVAIRP